MQSGKKENIATTPLNVHQQLNVDVVSGMITGIFNSALFSPIDRALHLAVRYKRPVLSPENFANPYQGVSQAIVQRAFLGSVYYIMQGEMKCYLYPYLHDQLKFSEPLTQFCIGITAGTTSGILTNGISAVKYYTWGGQNRTFFSSFHEMRTQGGLRPFMRGTAATVSRDTIFGSIYEVFRHTLHDSYIKSKNKLPNIKDDQLTMLCNATAGVFATAAGSPINYARNRQFATAANLKAQSIPKILANVWEESKKEMGTCNKMRFFQRKFQIGWGTARVGLGMAVGQKVFDYTRSLLGRRTHSKT